MYKIFHNIDGEKISIFNTETEFLIFINEIAKENEDKAITTINEAMQYLDTYCENLTLLDKTVFIAGFESDPEQNGVSGWQWHSDVKEIDTIYNGWLTDLTDCILYRGTVNVSSKYSIDEITDFIQTYLDIFDYENAFEDKIEL